MPIAWWFLAAAAGTVFYVLFGYPMLLAWGPRRRAPVVKKDLAFEPAVSVVMAVYNGGAHIRQKLESLTGLDYPKNRLEIIVVSDGSTDETDSVAREFANRGVILSRVPRGGKAAALNRAFETASGEILFFTDVRQPLSPLSLRHLVANLADPSVGVVTGELKLLSGDAGEQADMDLYWKYEIWARTRQSEIYSLFNATGCIYAMRRSLVQALPPDTIADDATLPLRAFFQGYRIVFEPEAVAFDYPAIAGTEFRRRFRTLAGLWQVHARIPALFGSGNRMRFHFLSHKFGRLILPWALLLAVGSTIALPPSWFRTGAEAGEIALLILALLSPFLPAGFPLKRLASPARTFLVMNAAALISLAVFFVPVTRIWGTTKVAIKE